MNKAQREVVIRCVTDGVQHIVAKLDKRITALERQQPKGMDFRPGDEVMRDGRRFKCTGQLHGKARWRPI